ncbi:PAS domain-containing sensor histidine kinase [Bacteroidota bacterium]
MSGRIFYLKVLIRTLLIIITGLLIVLSFGVLGREKIFTLIVGIFLILIQTYMLTRFVNKINKILIQFIESIDLNKSADFQLSSTDKIFSELRKSLNLIHSRVRKGRMEVEKQSILLDTVVNSIDTGLISFNKDGDIIFINQLARTILENNNIRKLSEVQKTRPELYKAFVNLKPDKPVLFKTYNKGNSFSNIEKRQSFSLRLKSIIIDSQLYNIISLQNIFEEIEKNELESWQKLIRILTHEIMNAVSPILSLVSTLKNYFTHSESGSQKSNTELNNEIINKTINGLQTIEVTGGGLIHFVNEYKRLSGLPKPQMKIFNLGELLNHIVTLMDSDIRHFDINLNLTISPENINLLADKTQIEQVLINLFKNSIEALKQKTKKSINLTAEIINERVVIQVEDNGEGMSPETIDKIFIPFFTTREKGSGIGLSLTRQIMRNHDGFIQVNSVKNEKTVFSLHF